MTTNIDLLIFDLGNVLVDIDWDKRWTHLARILREEWGIHIPDYVSLALVKPKNAYKA